jgi:hypothetical protein
MFLAENALHRGIVDLEKFPNLHLSTELLADDDPMT